VRGIAAWSQAERRKRDPRPWYTECFAAQRKLLDAAPDAWESVLGTRRGGKTHGIGAFLLDGLMQNPKLPSPYITLTRDHSMRNLFPYLDAQNRRHKLGLRWKDNKLCHPKGGYIWLAGCKDKREAEKFRGDKHGLGRVAIDEGGAWRDAVLRYLVYDALSAALTDNSSPLLVSGSPGPVPTGMFWAITTNEDKDNPGWPTHHFNVINNPHHRFFNNPEAIRKFREEKLKMSEAHPTWIREYLGQWCLDTTALIYYFDPVKNAWDGVLPSTGIRRITLGVDVGYEDETAFVICASIWGQPNVYIMYAGGQSHMLPSAIAAEIKRLVKLYGVQEIYMDTGGLAVTMQHQLAIDYGVPVNKATKTEKVANILRTQDALQRGELLANRATCKPLIDEANVLVWDVDPDTKERKGHRPGMADHCCDALLYSYRPHLHQRPPPAPPEVTPEQRQAEEHARIRQEAMRSARSANR
jgi:hypothetical protein